MKSIEEIGKRFDAEARVCEQMSGDVPFQRDLADLAAHMQRIEAKVSERNLWLANKVVSLVSEIVDNKKDDTARREAAQRLVAAIGDYNNATTPAHWTDVLKTLAELQRVDTSISEIAAEIGARVPDEEWAKVPTDLSKRAEEDEVARLRDRLAAAEAALDDWEHSYPGDADRMKGHQEWRALAEGEETDHE